MRNTQLLVRPWSYHRPKVPGYEPLIQSQVVRVGRRRRNSWRCTVLVDGCAMFNSHHDTKAAAESKAATVMESYCDTHYESR